MQFDLATITILVTTGICLLVSLICAFVALRPSKPAPVAGLVGIETDSCGCPLPDPWASTFAHWRDYYQPVREARLEGIRSWESMFSAKDVRDIESLMGL